MRISHKKYVEEKQKAKFDFKKDYRKTDDYKETYDEISKIIKKYILPYAEISNLIYTKDSLEIFLNQDYKTDFNDKHIINLCKKNNFYLLTHDGDYKNSDINVISYNPKLSS
ncbi:MAG: hypothetical protein A2086_13905 [Spirochaetes bacterium GWD1_27_9]|nr:MAG: hypothetical protein A2Z98_14340 [Spirochaetes bacterium GWB1_27_13]OHD22275.1 MAG: hypothetical protein A2Y34_06115 [Spirochaetes bacterium GWC1_27_15]OHD44091.1 MAG: hypothetical protein A2086_13905 [Spirochaetes bacterium GWD1_27_9]